MPILRPGTVQDTYRLRASLPSLHDLTGRPDPEFTNFITRNIYTAISPTREDVLLDIGCGDGSLLRMCDCSKVGILPSAEEVARLRSEFPELDIRQGLAQSLPVPDSFATKVVCNGVITCITPESEVIKALSEISRVAAKGAAIYIGELPDVDELAEKGRDYGASIGRWLAHLQRKSLYHLLAGMKDLAVSALTSKTFFLEPPDFYFVTPAHFIAMAEKFGLEHVRHFRRMEPHGPSTTRFDYIFMKSREDAART